MSDLSPTDGWNDDDVELASAYLDGELGADEAARVESDPRLVALVDSLGALSERLAVDAPGEDVVDAHVAAAMAALDDAPAGARVVQLSSERRRRWYDRIPLGAVAAALVIVALLGAATQLDLGGDDDTATATAGDSGDDTAGSEAFAETGEALGDGAGGGDAGTMDAPVAATPPLEFDTTDALADHVSALVSGVQEESSYSRSDLDSTAGQGSDRSSDEAAGGGAAPPCDPVAAADIDSAPLLLLLPALVSGRDVTAVVVDDGGDQRLVVVDHVSCAVVDDRFL